MKQIVKLSVEIFRKGDQLCFTHVYKAYNIKNDRDELFAVASLVQYDNNPINIGAPNYVPVYAHAAISVETNDSTPLWVNFYCDHAGYSKPYARGYMTQEGWLQEIPANATKLKFSEVHFDNQNDHLIRFHELGKLFSTTDSKADTEKKIDKVEKTVSSSPSFFRRAAPAILATAGLIGGTLGIISMITDSRKKP